MAKKYSYKENIIWFAKKQITFNENIAEIIEFEKCVVIRNTYSNENPTNNLSAFDFHGNKIWGIDDVIKPLESQTIVSIGRSDGLYVSIITFTGLNLLIEAESGQIVDKKITKQQQDGQFLTGCNYSIPTQQQMHDAVTQWARREESLANSKTQLNRFNTASVVYDSATGDYYYGMNRGVQLSGDELNSSLKSWLPEKSLNDYKLGNCAEVDAINQALNSGADINELYVYTINTKTNLPKPMCENCSYTFGDRVADVFSK